MHFYITFGTNLLTQSPVPVPVFSLVSVFRRKRISNGVQTDETFGNVIFGTNVIHRTWSLRKKINEESTRQGGAPSTLMGPSWLP